MHPMAIRAEARDGYRLWLEYDDGLCGEVDLSDLAGEEDYAVWRDYDFFRSVRVDSYGDIAWSDDLLLSPEHLYAELRGISIEEQEAIWAANEQPPPLTPKPTRVEPRGGCRIWLEYDDGSIGELDLSPLLDLGMFRALRDRSLFERVRITDHGAVVWSDDLELGADSLYLRLTGDPPAGLTDAAAGP